MTRRAALLLLTAFAACTSSSSSPPLNPIAWTPPFSEQEVVAGYAGTLKPGMSVLVQLEPSSAHPAAGTDTGTPGVDSFPMKVRAPLSFQLCFQSARAHRLSLRPAGGGAVASVTASTNPACQGSQVSLAAGDYVVDVTHAGTDAVTYPLLLSVKTGALPAASPTALATDSTTVTVTPVTAYDPTMTYENKTLTLVEWAGVTYQLFWYASPYDCPVAGPSPQCVVNQGQWKVYDPNLKTEASYYDYPGLLASYPNPPACTAADYGIAAANAHVDASIASGDMKLAAPTGGYTTADRQALYREFMLPCLPPDLSKVAASSLPANVQTVMSVMPLATWQVFASKVASVDGSNPRLSGSTDSTAAYWQFLKAVARYPYFCGEVGGRNGVGAYASLAEACRRDLAAFFAHAAVETGGANPFTSFEYLREGAAMGNTNYQPVNGCASPFVCPGPRSLYYGRGPKQLSYFYNYAGFSAARFVTTTSAVDGAKDYSFNFLLEWPDLVAYDPELYFLSGLWFVMTNQPPKPSMHDVIMHRYVPDTSCTERTCAGLAYDATNGLTHPFTATIELINGGVECRPGKDNLAPTNRSSGYKASLTTLGATLTAEEQNLPAGCASVIAHSIVDESTVFARTSLQAGLNTWIDLANPQCTAYSLGGTSPVSVTAGGIVAACKGL